MSKPGYVYVAIDEDRPGYCKIGQTIDPKKRAVTLKGATLNSKIEIVESVPVGDMNAVERAFHEILRYRHRVGEWFNIEAKHVLPMLSCVADRGASSPATPAKDESTSPAVGGRGSWHEAGWQMHCRGATQAEVAEEFGVTEGAVVALKKKMRAAGRGHEEANRGKDSPSRFVGEAVESADDAPTPQSAYRQPIVDVLTELGGRGRAKDVLEGVRRRMRHQLHGADYKQLKSGQEVWANKTQWARQQLKQEGVLRADSPHGWWELA